MDHPIFSLQTVFSKERGSRQSHITQGARKEKKIKMSMATMLDGIEATLKVFPTPSPKAFGALPILLGTAKLLQQPNPFLASQQPIPNVYHYRCGGAANTTTQVDSGAVVWNQSTHTLSLLDQSSNLEVWQADGGRGLLSWEEFHDIWAEPSSSPRRNQYSAAPPKLFLSFSLTDRPGCTGWLMADVISLTVKRFPFSNDRRSVHFCLRSSYGLQGRTPTRSSNQSQQQRNSMLGTVPRFVRSRLTLPSSELTQVQIWIADIIPAPFHPILSYWLNRALLLTTPSLMTPSDAAPTGDSPDRFFVAEALNRHRTVDLTRAGTKHNPLLLAFLPTPAGRNHHRQNRDLEKALALAQSLQRYQREVNRSHCHPKDLGTFAASTARGRYYHKTQLDRSGGVISSISPSNNLAQYQHHSEIRADVIRNMEIVFQRDFWKQTLTPSSQGIQHIEQAKEMAATEIWYAFRSSGVAHPFSFAEFLRRMRCLDQGDSGDATTSKSSRDGSSQDDDTPNREVLKPRETQERMIRNALDLLSQS